MRIADLGCFQVTDRQNVPIVAADPSDRHLPVFPSDVLEELFEFGERRELAGGDVLYRAGESNSDFFVLIDGKVEVGTVRRRILAHGSE
jgi:hypothetical protein